MAEFSHIYTEYWSSFYSFTKTEQGNIKSSLDLFFFFLITAAERISDHAKSFQKRLFRLSLIRSNKLFDSFYAGMYLKLSSIAHC